MNAIDITTETLLDFPAACREAAFRNARTGKPCHISQLYRYSQFGARNIHGHRTKLEAVKTPSGMRTSREAIVRFIAALTDPDRPAPTPRARQRRADAAERELETAGFEVGGA